MIREPAMLRVRRIQRYCLDDGPGIRTTVFCQGCPMRCWWCHNPEARELCADAASWAPEQLAETLMRDRRYWLASGGGVTFSGGEPLAQTEALGAAIDELRSRRIHVAVCTSAQAGTADFQALEGKVDRWLVDLKCVSPARYRQATGGDVETTLDNLAGLIGSHGWAVTVRVPLIAGFNDDLEELSRMAEWLAGQSADVALEILPGHDLCRQDGQPSARPADLSVRRARETFLSSGLACTVLSGAS